MTHAHQRGLTPLVRAAARGPWSSRRFVRVPARFLRRGVVVLGVGLVGCGGGPPADIFVVTRSGDVEGARLELRLTDDGRVACNGRPLVALTSDQLIDARQLRRELEGEEEGETGPADEGLSLPAGPGAVFRYVVRGQDGTISFSDTSPGQPQTFREVAALTRRVAQGPCRLER